uniref:Uncharacterized protein n=1 Tax=Anopheles culicifacies TaxID=139723 RepID=A0A182MW05_9DIPT
MLIPLRDGNQMAISMFINKQLNHDKFSNQTPPNPYSWCTHVGTGKAQQVPPIVLLPNKVRADWERAPSCEVIRDKRLYGQQASALTTDTNLPQPTPLAQGCRFSTINRNALLFARLASPRQARPVRAGHATGSRCQDMLLRAKTVVIVIGELQLFLSDMKLLDVEFQLLLRTKIM